MRGAEKNQNSNITNEYSFSFQPQQSNNQKKKNKYKNTPKDIFKKQKLSPNQAEGEGSTNSLKDLSKLIEQQNRS